MQTCARGIRWVTPMLALTLWTQPALAYVGPGAGLSAIGAVLALLAGILLSLVGFVWYPIHRLLGVRRRRKQAENARSGADSPEAVPK